MQNCKKCNELLSFDLFPKDKKLKTGFGYTCKKCVSEYKKEHYLKNKEKYILKAKVWKSNNIEKTKISNKKSRDKNKDKNYLKNKIWQENNREKVSLKSRRWQINNKEKFDEKRIELHKHKLKNDEVYYLKTRIRSAISSGVKRNGYSKKSKTQDILGCTYVFFRNYIESQFKKGMNWSNIHLDHIKPLASAKTEEEVYSLNHYTNFQPLLIADNFKKGSKTIEKQLLLL